MTEYFSTRSDVIRPWARVDLRLSDTLPDRSLSSSCHWSCLSSEDCSFPLPSRLSRTCRWFEIYVLPFHFAVNSQSLVLKLAGIYIFVIRNISSSTHDVWSQRTSWHSLGQKSASLKTSDLYSDRIHNVIGIMISKWACSLSRIKRRIHGWTPEDTPINDRSHLDVCLLSMKSDTILARGESMKPSSLLPSKILFNLSCIILESVLTSSSIPSSKSFEVTIQAHQSFIHKYTFSRLGAWVKVFDWLNRNCFGICLHA